MSHVLDNRTKHTQLMQQEIVKLDLEKAHQQYRQCSIKIGQHCLGQAVSFPQQRSLTDLSDRDQQKPARKDRMGLGGGLKPPQAPAVHAAGEAQLLLVSRGGVCSQEKWTNIQDSTAHTKFLYDNTSQQQKIDYADLL